MERKPAVAGAFYPGNAGDLKKKVSSFLEKKPSSNPDGKILGLLVPHAGYTFSGAVAGEGFSAVRDMDFKTAVILGTGHGFPVNGGAVYKSGSFLTPLGSVVVDEDMAGALIKKTALFENLPQAHEDEHSIEVQLPFLQLLRGDALKIVPLLFNTSELSVVKVTGKVLADVMKGTKSLLCVSSDFSHFPPADTARRADTTILLALKMAMRLKDVSYFELANRLLLKKGGSNLSCVCCGVAAVMAGARACMELGADDFQLLCYTNSGEISGDRSRTVGYAAGLFVKSDIAPDPSPPVPKGIKKELLGIARKSIENRLKSPDRDRIGGAGGVEFPLSEEPALNLPGAVFVTLTLKEKLKGCIGTLQAESILQDAVAHFAVSAAFDDPRFAPLTSSELAGTKIEISVLSPLKRVANPDEIKPGMHGVFIKRGSMTGTYLPQVWEHFENREDFLNSLCAEKAGLDAGAWKKPSTELYTYTVEAFKE